MKSLHRGCAAGSVALCTVLVMASIARAAPEGVPPPLIQPDSRPILQHPAPWTAPTPVARRGRGGTATAGVYLFLGTYMVTAVSGLLALCIHDNLGCDHCTEVGASYLLPGAGPFL